MLGEQLPPSAPPRSVDCCRLTPTRRSEVKAWRSKLQALGDRLDASTDRVSHLELCHGLAVVSSRSVPRLRRRGRAASPESLSTLQSALRDLCLLRSRPGVLLVAVSHRRAPCVRPRRSAASSPQSRRAPRSSRPSAGVPRPREGSHFPAGGHSGDTVGRHDDGSGADRASGGRVALHGLWPGKRLAPSAALADPSRVSGDAP